MDDLISRKAILGYPLRRGNAGCGEANANPHFLNGVESVMEYALNLPTVAAEPVRHAYWIDITQEDDDCLWWHCSCCSGVDKGSRKPRYCRACGARMDAKEESQ